MTAVISVMLAKRLPSGLVQALIREIELAAIGGAEYAASVEQGLRVGGVVGDDF